MSELLRFAADLTRREFRPAVYPDLASHAEITVTDACVDLAHEIAVAATPAEALRLRVRLRVLSTQLDHLAQAALCRADHLLRERGE